MAYTKNGISMRPLESADLEWLRAMRNDESTWMNLNNIPMMSDKEEQEWFARLQGDKSRGYFVVYKPVGFRLGIIRFTQIDYINRSICVGADIELSQRGQGYSKKIYDLLLDYCFNYLNMNRVWLMVAEFNEIAHHVYLAKGFKQEGLLKEALFRHGKYWDCIMMAILKEDYNAL